MRRDGGEKPTNAWLRRGAVTLIVGAAGILAGCQSVPTSITEKMPTLPGMAPRVDKTIVERMRTYDMADAAKSAANGAAPSTPQAPPDPAADLDNRRIYSYIVPSAPITAYLNRLLDQVKQVSPRPNLPARVYVIYDTSLNADTTPAGNIFVSLGWLKQAHSEDELLALIAHEYGHIALKHYDFDELANNQKRLKLLSGGLFLLRERFSTNNENAVLTAGETNRLKMQENLIQVMDAVIHPGWKRAQELDADRYALDTLILMKRSPKGLLEFFEDIEAQDVAATEAKAKAAKEAAAEARNAPPVANQKFSWSDLLDPTLAQLKSDTHPSSADRTLSVDTYRDALYPADGQPRIRAQMGGLGKVCTENKQLFDNYEKAHDSQIKLALGDPKEALKLAKQATTGPTARHAYPLAQQFQAQIQLRQTKEANATFGLITKAEDPTWKEYDFYLEHSNADQKTKDALLEAGFQKFHQAPTLQAARITYYKKNGNLKLANELVGICTARTPEYRDGCEKSLK